MQSATRDHKYTCCQWDVIDIQFTATKAPPAPFVVTFGAVFSGPDGQKLKVPGFYNGGRAYVIRFSPPQVGDWDFITYASLPSLVNYQGSVACTPQLNPKRHGPVVLHPNNPQRFAYADGEPYYLMAFECDWLFALDADNKEDIPTVRQLVDQITAMGFNHIVMNLFAYDVPWKKDPNVTPEHDFSAPSLYPFGGTNTNPDFTVLSVAFFLHLDRIIRYLDHSGIVAHLMIYVWNKLVNWPEMYSEMDNTYFDYVISRYQAFTNVVWDISKEALGYGRCDMAYVIERIHRARQLDAFKRLLTVHDYGFCEKYSGLVDFISIQTWSSDLYRRMLEVTELHHDKPVLNIEHGGYESGPYVIFPGDYTDARTCLERNYACVFAGAYSTYYWQCTSWNVVISNPMALPERLKPQLQYYHHLAGLFKRYDFATLNPSKKGHSSGFALTDGEKVSLYVIPKQNYAIHVTHPGSEQDEVMVTWFNPYSGDYVIAGLAQKERRHEFISPWMGQMAVLILEAVK